MQSNYRQVKQVLWLILLANFIVALLKIVVGIAIRSTSMTADGFHSISDTTSNILGIIGITLASKPGDKEHPYGHSKFEVISGLFIGAMLLFLAGKIILDALVSFRNPVLPDITLESLIVLLITLLINIFVSNYEHKMGKKLNSYILISDSLHTKSDIFVSIGVLVTLVGVKFGLPIIIDPIVSLVVVGFILHASYEIFKSTINVLVDKAIIDDKDVISVLNTFKEIIEDKNIQKDDKKNLLSIMDKRLTNALQAGRSVTVKIGDN
ncbi:MAG: cation transporter, partial [Romboutsia sp.]|nr:cation transporter [Romboutsia sp.]